MIGDQSMVLELLSGGYVPGAIIEEAYRDYPSDISIAIKAAMREEILPMTLLEIIHGHIQDINVVTVALMTHGDTIDERTIEYIYGYHKALIAGSYLADAREVSLLVSAIASCANTPKEILDEIFQLALLNIQAGNNEPMLGFVRNPNSSSSFILEIWQMVRDMADFDLVCSFAMSNNASYEVFLAIVSLCDISDENFLEPLGILAENPSVPSEILEMIYEVAESNDDVVMEISEALLRNPSIPQSLLVKIWDKSKMYKVNLTVDDMKLLPPGYKFLALLGAEDVAEIPADMHLDVMRDMKNVFQSLSDNDEEAFFDIISSSFLN